LLNDATGVMFYIIFAYYSSMHPPAISWKLILWNKVCLSMAGGLILGYIAALISSIWM
jgi:hypothetical protein